LRAWSYANDNKEEISQHWHKRIKGNPSFFNGRVLVMENYLLEGGVLEAQFMETEFASFLYWKDHGFQEAGAKDAFGSALIRARDGEVLLARQRVGNLNAGLAYMPGGFIDRRDVGGDGVINIDQSVARELEEEASLPFSAFTRTSGYVVTVRPTQISIGIELVSSLDAVALRRVLMDNIARQDVSELDDFLVFDAPPSPDDRGVAEFTRFALAELLGPNS